MSTRDRQASRLERELVGIARREEERLGRDLHDGLCQVLSGVKIQAGLLARRLAANRSPLAGEAADMEKRLAEAIRQARGIARGLAPPELELGELEPALQQLAKSLERQFGLQCACKCAGLPKVLAPDFASHIYRIAREAALNAAKHGKGRRIVIELAFRSRRFSLQVSNDGPKFRAPKAHAGLGLRLMQCRARVLAAALTVEPGPRSGCVVRCEGALPARPKAAACS